MQNSLNLLESVGLHPLSNLGSSKKLFHFFSLPFILSLHDTDDIISDINEIAT